MRVHLWRCSGEAPAWEESVLADWRASGDVAWISHLSAGRPTVLRAALDDLLREFSQTGEAEAGVAAVLAAQAYVLAVTDQLASERGGPAESIGRSAPVLLDVREVGPPAAGDTA